MERYKRGRNPNSLASLKKEAGPGRPKTTTQERMIKKAVKDYLREYLEEGMAIKDFERVREKKPDVALNMALDRTYGPPGRPQGESSAFNVNMLIAVLTGKDPEAESNPIEAGEAEKVLIPGQNP